MNTIIRLDSIKKVKDFVNKVERFYSEFLIQSGRYVIDGKSIMGIFSLDLSKDLSLEVEFDDRDNATEIIEFINKYTKERS